MRPVPEQKISAQGENRNMPVRADSEVGIWEGLQDLNGKYGRVLRAGGPLTYSSDWCDL